MYALLLVQMVGLTEAVRPIPEDSKTQSALKMVQHQIRPARQLQSRSAELCSGLIARYNDLRITIQWQSRCAEGSLKVRANRNGSLPASTKPYRR